MELTQEQLIKRRKMQAEWIKNNKLKRALILARYWDKKSKALLKEQAEMEKAKQKNHE